MTPEQKAVEYLHEQVLATNEPINGVDRFRIREAYQAGYNADRWIAVTLDNLIPFIDAEALFWHKEGNVFVDFIDKDAIEYYYQIATHYQLITPPTT